MRRVAIACALLVGACTGAIDPTGGGPSGNSAVGAGSSGSSAGGAAGDGSGGGGPGPGAHPTVADACKSVDVGITPLRRLSRTEYNNSVRDLLGDTTHPADAFAPDEKLLGFAAGLNVSALLAEQYQTAAEALAAKAIADIPGLLGCQPETAGTDPCVNEFIDRFGKRAYRRPLADEERSGLTSLYESARGQWGYETGVRLVLEAVLQSPQFIYRIEIGTPASTADLVELSSYDLASRLSYLIWQTTPDEELMAAADQDELRTPEQLEAQARRMIADERAHDTVKSFHAQWLELDKLETVGKDETMYPNFDDAMRASMEEETLRFAEHVVFEGDGTVNTLLRGAFSFVDARLADIYGVSAPSQGFAKVDLDPNQRSGLLTQPSILSIYSKANQSSPVHRGKFVRERLLCHQLRPPPKGLIIVPPEVDPSLPTRERFSQHTNPDCAQCHDLTDPIGFGFEHYDAVGRWRDKDGTFTVDATGEVLSTRDADGPFDGAIELAERLAGSQQVRDCVAGNWFTYAFGRSITNSLDVCSRAKLYESFEKSGFNIRELLVALVTTDAFRYRRLPTP